MYVELLLHEANSKVEITEEDPSIYSNTSDVRRTIACTKRNHENISRRNENCWFKIGFEVIGFLRMRLNYRNSSNFGHDPAFLWFRLLHKYLGYLKVLIYFKGFSKTKTLLIAFGTGYKRGSLLIMLRVTYVTGEVSFYFLKKRWQRIRSTNL